MTLVIKRGAQPLTWTISSVGQSGRLITDSSRVRVPDGPLGASKRLVKRVAPFVDFLVSYRRCERQPIQEGIGTLAS